MRATEDTQDDWSERLAPSLADIEAIADEAFARLPISFRRMAGTIVIRVVDFPDDDVVEELEADSAFDILGLFTGHGLAQDAAVPETGRLPNVIYLYRRPILDYWAEHEETLGDLVTHVLVHEIGHHFGLSDADMKAIEAAAA